MSNTADIIPWVALYRALDRPELSNWKLETTISVMTQDLVDCFLQVHQSLLEHPRYGSGELTPTLHPNVCFYLQDRVMDKSNFTSKLLGEGTSLEISFPHNNEIRFHENVTSLTEHLGKTNSITLPQSYYLVDEDYLHPHDPLSKRPRQLHIIDTVVDFVAKLETLADAVDERNNTRTATFYVADTERSGKIQPISVDLKITPELLDLPHSAFAILDNVTGATPISPHDHERKVMLKAALHETMMKHGDKGNIISYLYKNWSKIDKAYHQHLETFIEGISFNKLRHEVEERGLSFLNDLNNSLSEISLKLTALPASFGVWVFFARNDQNLMSMLGFLVAIVMMTLLLNNSLKGLLEKLTYIEDMIERQTKSFSQRSNSADSPFENSKLKDDITALKNRLDKRVSSVKSHLQFYRFILWMPVVIMLGVFAYQYSLTAFFNFAVEVVSCLPLLNK